MLVNRAQQREPRIVVNRIVKVAHLPMGIEGMLMAVIREAHCLLVSLPQLLHLIMEQLHIKHKSLPVTGLLLMKMHC